MSKPTSRWLTAESSSWWRTSIGSSIVTMWHSRVWLMWSTMAASVVVFPQPVGPVTRIRPRCSSARRRTASGRFSSPKERAWERTSRKTMPMVLR